jgi:hypothetical protein
MNSEALEGVATKEEILAALRSRAYCLLGDCLEYPDEALCEAIRSGPYDGRHSSPPPAPLYPRQGRRLRCPWRKSSSR